MIKNNLFSFATSELSQDAFICWCVNWFNDPSKPLLREMAKDFLYKLLKIDDRNTFKIISVNIIRQYSQRVKIGNKTENVKIDVLLIINNSIAIIIEDKTFTSIHSNQIKRYAVGLKQIFENNGSPLSDIITVFWKTGHYYDLDKVTVANVKINSKDVKELIEPYINESEILEDYYYNLLELIKWYDDHKNYWLPISENSQTLNITDHYIAQYTLMREIFPEYLWKQIPERECEEYQVYSGSSFGRPWTELVIKWGAYKNDDEYSIFWRIDTDSKGPYISLRLYEVYPKDKLARHKELYSKLSSLMSDIIGQIPCSKTLGLDEAVKENNGSYKEAAFFHYHLDFSNWDIKRNDVIYAIQSINHIFVKRFALEVEPLF